MKTVTEHIRHNLLEAAGMIERPILPPPAELRRTEWCEEFEQFMRNRLLMGAFRYGLFNSPDKFDYDHLGSIRRRLERFEQDSNLEHLVDAANLCMCEFMKCKRHGMQLVAIDDGDLHAEVQGGG